MLPPPVAVTTAGEASRLSILMSCTIEPATERLAFVNRPNEPSNFGRVTVDDQSVVVSATESHSTRVLNGVAVAVGVMVLVGVVVDVAVRVNVAVNVGVIVSVAVIVG